MDGQVIFHLMVIQKDEIKNEPVEITYISGIKDQLIYIPSNFETITIHLRNNDKSIIDINWAIYIQKRIIF